MSGDSLERRVAGISKERREAIIVRSGARAVEEAKRLSGGDPQEFDGGSNWGFARTTLNIATSARAHQNAHHAPGPSQENSERRDPLHTARESFVSVLGRDDDFHSPYSYAAMRDAYGVMDGWSVVEGGNLSPESFVAGLAIPTTGGALGSIGLPIVGPSAGEGENESRGGNISGNFQIHAPTNGGGNCGSGASAGPEPGAGADVDRNGVVDHDDLSAVLDDMGSVCDGSVDTCRGDANGDGIVDADDLAEVVRYWQERVPQRE